MSDSLAEPAVAILEVAHWEAWFAWRPVRLYMTGQYAWLRPIYRRTLVKTAGACCEYTDDPNEFPDLPEAGPAARTTEANAPKPAETQAADTLLHELKS